MVKGKALISDTVQKMFSLPHQIINHSRAKGKTSWKTDGSI